MVYPLQIVHMLVFQVREGVGRDYEAGHLADWVKVEEEEEKFG